MHGAAMTPAAPLEVPPSRIPGGDLDSPCVAAVPSSAAAHLLRTGSPPSFVRAPRGNHRATGPLTPPMLYPQIKDVVQMTRRSATRCFTKRINHYLLTVSKTPRISASRSNSPAATKSRQPMRRAHYAGHAPGETRTNNRGSLPQKWRSEHQPLRSAQARPPASYPGSALVRRTTERHRDRVIQHRPQHGACEYDRAKQAPAPPSPMKSDASSGQKNGPLGGHINGEMLQWPEHCPPADMHSKQSQSKLTT